ncbi:hypothetical protein LPJ66_002981 [Kickxella alabastrina]|uniref:Uncharacterized protein n=1 Tax=Kickxella alabastrina TaxID=61397 RepID=A0ACC1ILW9_9FUNG|nr:hypothetical protein LPJ66_002981 [Kickxella alabastrina]
MNRSKDKTRSASADQEATEDQGNLSPQSWRRYQSRQSSARLRERQRLKVVKTGKEILRLENYVQSLQHTISASLDNNTVMSTATSLTAAAAGLHSLTAQGLMLLKAVKYSQSNYNLEIDTQAYQIIMLLEGATHWLGVCAGRINVLKKLLSDQVASLKLNMRQRLSSSSPSSGFIKVLPTPLDARGSISSTDSVSNRMGGITRVESVSELYWSANPTSTVRSRSGSKANSQTTSRIPISFLLDDN